MAAKQISQRLTDRGTEVIVYDDGSIHVTHRVGQWSYVVDGGVFTAFNPDPANTTVHRWYDLVVGQYGEPLIRQEPELGLPIPPGLHYLDPADQPTTPDPRMHIHGIVCCEPGNPSPVYRGSFSNFVKLGIPYAINADGTITVNGETWYIHALANADKGRILGYFAVAGRTPVQSVYVRELGDMSYLLLQ